MKLPRPEGREGFNNSMNYSVTTDSLFGGQGICLWPLLHTISSNTYQLNMKVKYRNSNDKKYNIVSVSIYQISGERSQRKRMTNVTS